METPIRGLYAALLTHRSRDGSVDFGAIERNAEFALSNGAVGLVPCGGTGEYFDLSIAERQELVEVLVPVVRGRASLVAGVGAAKLEESAKLAHHALAAGADAVLLPPPHFFRYGQPELRQFFREAAAAIGGPTLVYNLAGFVSPISPSTAADLLRDEEYIVGIKDSSGTLAMLRQVTRERIPCARLQGHDKRLAESLQEGFADGAISGPAGVVPEALAPLFEDPTGGPRFTTAAKRLEEFLRRLQGLPYPWVLKWAASLRGWGRATMPFPLSQGHIQDRKEFESWFEQWLASGEVSRGDPS
ncbi:MAG: dihydrodipicolinate synthase family protein [Bryobacterales bacterium]|nr:dihydrodipicolinate synthase family protein [Bryobacterales bacterium]